MGGECGEKIVIWDDGGVEKLQEELKSYEALAVCLFSGPTYSCPPDGPGHSMNPK